MASYYNENDAFAAAWLRELIKEGLIADGEVDERSIADVQPSDLAGFVQCHFFAGIGGWSYALRLAGWPDDRAVWTGSCPCQPFSSASRGRGEGIGGERDWWPTWRELIATGRPGAVFGEQVAQSGDWLDRVCDDMEGLGYAVGAAVLPALSVGQDHRRERIYFACHANRDGQSGRAVNAEASRLPRPRGHAGNLGRSDGVSALMAGYGNAIVPQVAAEFISAYMDVRSESAAGSQP